MQDKARESGAFSHLQKYKKFYTPEYKNFYTFCKKNFTLFYFKIFLENIKISLPKQFPASILRVETTNSIKITAC